MLWLGTDVSSGSGHNKTALKIASERPHAMIIFRLEYDGLSSGLGSKNWILTGSETAVSSVLAICLGVLEEEGVSNRFVLGDDGASSSMDVCGKSISTVSRKCFFTF